jgi:hypothetical protein
VVRTLWSYKLCLKAPLITIASLASKKIPFTILPQRLYNLCQASKCGCDWFWQGWIHQVPKCRKTKGTWLHRLGVMLCKQHNFQWVRRPPTAAGAISACIKKVSLTFFAQLTTSPTCSLVPRNPQYGRYAGECAGKVCYQESTNTFIRFNINTPTGWGLMRRKGAHEHPWPESNKPDRLT